MNPVRVIIVGGGSRGQTYAQYATCAPDAMRVVAVAEPREWHLRFLAEQHHIPKKYCFHSWEEVAKLPKFADAVIIATHDDMHVDPVLAFAALGYHILLEKPMATSVSGCRKIYNAVKKNHILFALCHVLRYTAYSMTLKKAITSGLIGDVVSVQHMEPIGYWHQAHSFVRGNWRNEKMSSPMLLQKSCHDIDWIRYIVGAPIERVSSMGSLKHFTPENRPEGAALFCLDCPPHIAAQCPYSAKRIYYNFLNENRLDWPLDVVVPEPMPEDLENALRNGPYGRCVYACDNDVMDHQSVNMAFQNGANATFLASAFTPKGTRSTFIGGTRGSLSGDMVSIEHFDFLSQQRRNIPIVTHETALGGHGGGDGSLIAHFIEAVRHNDPAFILSGIEESYESYRAVFAAERARQSHTVVAL